MVDAHGAKSMIITFPRDAMCKTVISTLPFLIIKTAMQTSEDLHEIRLVFSREMPMTD
jgi:hypothetical protein